MANQIMIDIVADSKKFTQGVDEVTKKTGVFSDKAKAAFAAASAAAAAYAAKLIGDGVKAAIEDEQAQVRLAGALKNVTGATETQIAAVETWITKQGELYGFTDDELRPAIERLTRSTKDVTEAQKLTNLAMDIAAQKNISVETAANALAKANDGNVNALKKLGITLGDNANNTIAYNKEQNKLNKLLAEQQFALEESGVKSKEYAKATEKVNDQQAILNEYTQESIDWVGELAKEFDGSASKAAETNAGKMKILNTRVGELKEGIGAALLPVVSLLVGLLLDAVDVFTSLPGPVQTVIGVLGAMLAIGVPLVGMVASLKTNMAILGVTSGTSAGGITAASVATNLLSAAMKALPILAIIALIVLLVQNWDNVTEAVGKVWEKIKEVVPKAWEKVKEFAGKVVGFVKDIIEAYLSIPGKMFEIGKDIVTGLWNGIQNMAGWLKDKVVGFFKNLLPDWAEKALGIKSPSKVFADIGKNIVSGLASTFNVGTAAKAITKPTTTVPKLTSSNTISTQKPGINITINAGLGTNGAQLGKQVSSAIKQYGKVSTKAVAFGAR